MHVGRLGISTLPTYVLPEHLLRRTVPVTSEDCTRGNINCWGSRIYLQNPSLVNYDIPGHLNRPSNVISARRKRFDGFWTDPGGFKRILHGFWTDFGRILTDFGRILADFGGFPPDFQRILDGFCRILDGFWRILADSSGFTKILNGFKRILAEVRDEMRPKVPSGPESI